MVNKMIILPGFTLLLVFFLLTAVVVVHKTKPYLGFRYWIQVVISSVVIGICATFTLFWNGLAYGFEFVLLAAGARTASEHMFQTKFGGLLLGTYFGFWLSLPFVVHQAI